MGVILKLKFSLIKSSIPNMCALWSSIFNRGNVHPEVIGTFLLKHVHSSAIYGSLKVETIQMATSGYSMVIIIQQ